MVLCLHMGPFLTKGYGKMTLVVGRAASADWLSEDGEMFVLEWKLWSHDDLMTMSGTSPDLQK